MSENILVAAGPNRANIAAGCNGRYGHPDKGEEVIVAEDNKEQAEKLESSNTRSPRSRAYAR